MDCSAHCVKVVNTDTSLLVRGETDRGSKRFGSTGTRVDQSVFLFATHQQLVVSLCMFCFFNLVWLDLANSNSYCYSVIVVLWFFKKVFV